MHIAKLFGEGGKISVHVIVIYDTNLLHVYSTHHTCTMPNSP